MYLSTNVAFNFSLSLMFMFSVDYCNYEEDKEGGGVFGSV